MASNGTAASLSIIAASTAAPRAIPLGSRWAKQKRSLAILHSMAASSPISCLNLIDINMPYDERCYFATP